MSRKTTRPTPIAALLGQTLLNLIEACRDIRIISRTG
jgi:hypothetical protein